MEQSQRPFKENFWYKDLRKVEGEDPKIQKAKHRFWMANE